MGGKEYKYGLVRVSLPIDYANKVVVLEIMP